MIFSIETSAVLSLLFAAVYYIASTGRLDKYKVLSIQLDDEDKEVAKEGLLDKAARMCNKLPVVPTHEKRLRSRSCRMDALAQTKYLPLNLINDTRSPSCAAAGLSGADGAGAAEDEGGGWETVPALKPGFAKPGPEEPTDAEGIPLALLPVMDKCDPHGPEAKQMQELFPEVPLCTIVRFLVARKGKVELSSEMLKNHLAWRKENLPLTVEKSAGVIRALETGVFFPYGVARDGSPVLVFRGGMYNAAVASPEDYTMAFAWGIEEALRNTAQLQVTVLANCRAAVGGTNAPAEMAFIKKLTGVLSDNFPERLKRTVLFPMPWYARLMKNAAALFMDPRSMAKIIFAGHDSDDRCPEMLTYISEDQITAVLGGTNPKPIPNVAAELKASFKKQKKTL